LTLSAPREEIKDLLILLKWSTDAAKSVSEDEIDDKKLLPLLSEVHITKLCSIMLMPDNRVDGHKVSIMLKITSNWLCTGSNFESTYPNLGT